MKEKDNSTERKISYFLLERTVSLWIWKFQKGSQRLVFVTAEPNVHFGEKKSKMRILIFPLLLCFSQDLRYMGRHSREIDQCLGFAEAKDQGEILFRSFLQIGQVTPEEAGLNITEGHSLFCCMVMLAIFVQIWFHISYIQYHLILGDRHFGF